MNEEDSHIAIRNICVKWNRLQLCFMVA